MPVICRIYCCIFFTIALFLNCGAPLYAQEKVQIETFRERDTSYINRLLDEARAQPDTDSALTLLHYALNVSKDRQYQGQIVRCLNMLGSRYSGIGHYEQAGTYFREGLLRARQQELHHFLPVFYNNIAKWYADQLNYDSAYASYHQALETTTLYPSPLISKAFIYRNMSVMLNTLYRLDEAAGVLKKAIQIAIAEKDTLELGACYEGLGNVYLAMNTDSSLLAGETYLLKARDIFRDTPKEAALLTALGNLYKKKKDYYGAIALYRQALMVPGVTPRQRIAASTNIGTTLCRLGKYKEAEPLLESVWAELEGQPLHADYRITAALNLARIYFARGKHEKAAPLYDLYIRLNDSLQGAQVNENINRLQLQYHNAQKDNELMKKQLLIAEQESALRQRNTLLYGLIGAMAAIGGFLWFYFRNRQKMQQQQSEIAQWHATLKGEENERRRLARELHDNIGGSLANLKMWFGSIQEKHEPLLAGQEYREVLQLLDQTLTEVRDTAHRLMPELLLRFGLAEAVRIFCYKVQKATGMVVEYEYFGHIGRLEDSLELLIYRSIQELVQNIVKHAGADKCLVQLSRHDDVLSVTIEDNGAGMDMTTLDANTGMGLQHIREGIRHIGGQFLLQSAPGKGTIVNIDISVEHVQI